MRISRVLAILAAVTVAVSYVAFANAGEIVFYYVGENNEVKVAQDVHYTLTDASGAKILDENVYDVEEGVRISDIAAGTYTVAAEQASTGYFGMKRVKITEDSEEPIVLGPDGVVTSPKYVDGDVALATEQVATVQPLPANYATPNSGAPCYGTPCYGTPGYGTSGFSSLGAMGVVAGVVGIVLGVVFPENKKPVSNIAF